MHNKVREPLFHIVKRDTLPWYQAWGIRAVAIVLALLLCALITTLCTHLNPIKVFGTMFGGAFGSPRKIWILGQNLAILLCISLAISIRELLISVRALEIHLANVEDDVSDERE